MDRFRVLRALVSASLMLGAALTQAAIGPPSGASQIPPLNTYTLPDQTASIQIPADWRVVQTGVAFIRAQGPNGELAVFGVVVPAHNSTAAAIEPGGVNQAYSADVKDKFTQSLGWVLQRIGQNGVPIHIVSNTPFKAPPEFGSCANFTMLLGARSGVAAEADFCSLPLENSGDYKNFFKIVGIGSARAKQERPMLEAILSSYRLNVAAIKQQSQTSAANAAPIHPVQGGPQARPPRPMPVQNSPMQAGSMQGQAAALVSLQQQQMAMRLAQMQTNAIMSSTAYAQRSSQRNFDTFDHDLRGDTPVYGDHGSQPLFWLSD
jgi:hypothetical protein